MQVHVCMWSLRTYLKESIFVVPELVIVADLHRYRLVTVNVAELYVSGIAHEEGAKEAGGA